MSLPEELPFFLDESTGGPTVPNTGQTVITITHPKNEIALKSGFPFRGRNLAVLTDALNSAAAGSKPITVDVRQNGGTGVRATGVVTAATPAAADTVSVNAAAMTAAQLHARGVVTAASVSDGDTVTAGGVLFTAKTTVDDGGYAQFAIGGGNNATATNLAAAVNAHPVANKLVSAVAAAAACKFRAVATGTAGNSVGLVSSNGTRLAVTGTSGSALSGGAAPSGDQWDYGDTDAQAATALAACVNRSATAGIKDVVTAAAAAAVVTFSATKYGPIGNLIALASSNGTRLAVTGVSSGKLTGGAEPAASPL